MRWHKMDDFTANAAPVPAPSQPPKKQRWPHRHKNQSAPAGATTFPPAPGVAPGAGSVTPPAPTAPIFPTAPTASAAPTVPPATTGIARPMVDVALIRAGAASQANQFSTPEQQAPYRPTTTPSGTPPVIPMATASSGAAEADAPAATPWGAATNTEQTGYLGTPMEDVQAVNDEKLPAEQPARQTETSAREAEAPQEIIPAIELIGEIDVNQGFGERIERLIALAVAEADTLREEAVADAKHERHDAKLDAERFVAAAQRQAAEIIAAAQRRAEGDLQAASDSRREAEQTLHQAHQEAETIRRRARDEAADLRKEIDNHAQALLARTHEDTTRTLVAARAEVEHLQTRKSELESQLAALRAMLQEAMAPKLPGLHDILTVPALSVPELSVPEISVPDIGVPDLKVPEAQLPTPDNE